MTDLQEPQIGLRKRASTTELGSENDKKPRVMDKGSVDDMKKGETGGRADVKASEGFLGPENQTSRRRVDKKVRRRLRQLPGEQYCCSCGDRRVWWENGRCHSCGHNRCPACLELDACNADQSKKK